MGTYNRVMRVSIYTTRFYRNRAKYRYIISPVLYACIKCLIDKVYYSSCLLLRCCTGNRFRLYLYLYKILYCKLYENSDYNTYNIMVLMGGGEGAMFPIPVPRANYTAPGLQVTVLQFQIKLDTSVMTKLVKFL